LGPHPADLRVKTDQTRNVGLVVLERIDVTLGGLLNDIFVKEVPAALLMKKPLGSELTSVIQPIGNSAR
jgi:hypothetical protein